MSKETLQRAATSISTGMWTLAGQRVPDCLAILVYHRVCPVTQGGLTPTWNVTPDAFRRQLSGLQELGYQFWPLSRVLEHRGHGKVIPERTTVLTFDDGYENNLTHALPVMKELNVPGTIFLSTAYLNDSKPFPFEPWGVQHVETIPPDVWRPLTSSQCREMLATGLVEFGAHTHTHQDFRGRPDAFAEDMRKNVRCLQSELGLTDLPFAFPFGRPQMGYTSPELIEAAKDAGVTCALSTDTVAVESTSDPYAWGRFSPFEWDTGRSLVAKFSGWYRWAPRIQDQLSFWLSDSTERQKVKVSTRLHDGSMSKRSQLKMGHEVRA